MWVAFLSDPWGVATEESIVFGKKTL